MASSPTVNGAIYAACGVLLGFVGGVSIWAYVADPVPEMALIALQTFFTAAFGLAAGAASAVYRNQDVDQRRLDALNSQKNMMHNLAQSSYKVCFRMLHEIAIVCNESFSWSDVVLYNEHVARRVSEAVMCLTAPEFHLFFFLHDSLPPQEQAYFSTAYHELFLARESRTKAGRTEREWQLLASMFVDPVAIHDGLHKWHAALDRLSWPQIKQLFDRKSHKLLGYRKVVRVPNEKVVVGYDQFEPRFYANARALLHYLRRRFGMSTPEPEVMPRARRRRRARKADADADADADVGGAPPEAANEADHEEVPPPPPPPPPSERLINWIPDYYRWILKDVPVRRANHGLDASNTTMHSSLSHHFSADATGMSLGLQSTPLVRLERKLEEHWDWDEVGAWDVGAPAMDYNVGLSLDRRVFRRSTVLGTKPIKKKTKKAKRPAAAPAPGHDGDAAAAAADESIPPPAMPTIVVSPSSASGPA